MAAVLASARGGRLASCLATWLTRRHTLGRMWASLVEGLVRGLDVSLAVLDLALQVLGVAYMFFYQVGSFLPF